MLGVIMINIKYVRACGRWSPRSITGISLEGRAIHIIRFVYAAIQSE
jgi:hypothetical protein